MVENGARRLALYDAPINELLAERETSSKPSTEEPRPGESAALRPANEVFPPPSENANTSLSPVPEYHQLEHEEAVTPVLQGAKNVEKVVPRERGEYYEKPSQPERDSQAIEASNLSQNFEVAGFANEVDGQTNVTVETVSQLEDFKFAARAIDPIPFQLEAQANPPIIINKEVASEEQIVQVEYFIASLPKNIHQGIQEYLSLADLETAELVQELVLNIAAAADRLQVLAAAGDQGELEATQIEELVRQWCEELLLVIGVEVDEASIIRLVSALKAENDKLPEKTTAGDIDKGTREHKFDFSGLTLPAAAKILGHENLGKFVVRQLAMA